MGQTLLSGGWMRGVFTALWEALLPARSAEIDRDSGDIRGKYIGQPVADRTKETCTDSP